MESETAVLSLLAEWEERRDRGAAVTPEELCAAAPHLAAALRRVIGMLEACDRLLGVDDEPPPAARTDPAPTRIGAYEIQGELGRGGMGVVYRAWDPALCRTVALKTLRPATPAAPDDVERLVRRFRQEGQVLARLRHGSIVPVHEARLDDAGPYFVMEYVPGGSLADHRGRLTAAGPAAVADFLEHVARAVAHAHVHGVLHRDLKPGNILLDADGRPRVSDFGLAKLLDLSADAGDAPPAAAAGPDDTAESAGFATPMTAPGHQPGTWAYMAPEQFDAAFGPVGPATDVWALGVILYELLTGRRPFPGSRWEELREQVCRGPVLPVGPGRPRALRRRLERVVRRCLEKEPAKRYRTAGELADALRQAVAPRRRWLIAGGLVAALGVAALAAALWHPPEQAANFQTQAAADPVWPDFPPIHDALDRLRRGEEVVLIDGGPPAALHWAMGPASGKLVERDDGTVGLLGNGVNGCLLELLPRLPAGRYRIDAELRHDGDGHGSGEIGVYAAGVACELPRGRQAFFAALRYGDFGPPASLPRTPDDPGRRLATPGAVFLGEDPRRPRWQDSFNVTAAKRYWTIDPQAGPPGWRRLSLEVDETGIVVGWEGETLGVITTPFLVQARAQVCARFPDLGTALPPVRTHGALGLYAYNALAGVRRFSVRPVPAPDR